MIGDDLIWWLGRRWYLLEESAEKRSTSILKATAPIYQFAVVIICKLLEIFKTQKNLKKHRIIILRNWFSPSRPWSPSRRKNLVNVEKSRFHLRRNTFQRRNKTHWRTFHVSTREIPSRFSIITFLFTFALSRNRFHQINNREVMQCRRV